ncbi:MAG: acyltransferase family protein [Pseudoxanthomonas sp.]
MGGTTETRDTATRIDDIECLRGLAVLGVLVHHAHGNLITQPLAWFDTLNAYFGFWAGVDLFFAISGFVIARSLLPELRAATGDRTVRRTLAAFWIRRCFRLLPSAWLWLALILLAVAFYNQSGVFGTLKANLWATVAALANVANFRFADGFMRYEIGVSFVYWSLSLEEQFYLLLPLCALLLRRYLLWMLLTLIVIQALIALRTPLLMAVRTDALAWGVLLAIVHGSPLWQRMQPKLDSIKWLRPPVIVVVLALLPFLAGEHSGLQISQRVSAIAVVSVTLVWLASYNRDFFCRGKWVKRLSLWAGSRSYAIYLIHIPVYFLIRETAFRIGATDARESPYSLAIYAVAATILISVLAEATYRLVDSPFRSVGKALAHRIRSGSTRQVAIATPTPTD